VGIAELAIEGGCSALIASERLLGVVARTHAHRLPLIVRTSPGAGAADAVARRLRNAGAVGICVPLSADPAATPEGILALVAATQAEGLFALVHTPIPAGPPREGLPITAATLGGALAWQDLVAAPLDPNMATGVSRAGATKADGAVVEALRAQHAAGWLGRVGMLGGTPEGGKDPLRSALRGAVFNKRAGGMGQVTGRSAAALPREQGVALLHAIQDVYLCGSVTVAV
jgi:class I fructose-bisphosphate aldolase